jgi:hypothetical protein
MDFEAWYGSYLQTYLERDVRTLNNIGNLSEFQKFLQLLAVRCSQILNLNNMAQELGIAVNTIKKWVSVLEASQIIYLLSPYYRNLGKRITKNPKVYFLDCGLVCYLAGIQDKKHLLNGPMAGALFENYVVQETVKAFMNMGKLPNMFYLRTHNNMEIDLLLERNQELFPYEIKLTRSPGESMGGSIDRFRQTFTGFDIKQGNILCLSDESYPLTRTLAVQTLDTFLDSLKRKIS